MPSKSVQSKNIADLRGTQSVIEYVATFLSAPSLGLSEVASKVVRDLIERRIRAMREDLIEALRADRIPISDAIAADDVASYIFRLHRAAVEGLAREKLRLMSCYFFKREANEKRGNDFLEAASIIEQLSPEEIRCLAVYKAALVAGWDLLKEDEETGIWQRMDLLGLFPSPQEFQTVAQSLVRFGFVRMASGWGTVVLYEQPRLIDFLNNLNLEDLTWSG